MISKHFVHNNFKQAHFSSVNMISSIFRDIGIIIFTFVSSQLNGFKNFYVTLVIQNQS